MSSKTLLVIGYVWPEPNSSAAGYHMLSLLRLFKAQGWQVVFASPAQKTEHMTDLATESIRTVEIKLNDSSFDDFVAELSPNYVLYDRFMMEEQFAWRVEKNAPNALHILDTEDLQCLRRARELAVKQQRDFVIDDLQNEQSYREVTYREIAAIFRCDLSLIISDYEIKLLENYFKVSSALVHHFPFMAQASDFKQGKSFQQREHFVTIGNFRHAPNWDSVLFLQHIWPLIRQALPQAELHIYGSYPPKKATQLHNPKTGFLIKGWAEDALQVLGDARVCLAPLRFGAGIKGKLFDAMKTGTPSVTTDIGIEGMATESEWAGAVANDPETIAKLAIQLYQDEKFWQNAQSNILPLVSKKFDGVKNGQQLIATIKQIEKDLSEHRQQNFIGNMLRHHSMKSTMYLSKWIEEKSKSH